MADPHARTRMKRVPVVLGSLLVLGILLGVPLSGMVPPTRATASGPIAPVGSFQNPLGPRTATLLAASGSVAAGAGSTFHLTISGTNCLTGAPPDEAVVSVIFLFGDGARLPTTGVANERSCTGAPWNESISISYDYIDTGTFVASAVVTWGDGYSVTTDPVSVSVGPAANPVGVAVTEFAIGFGIAAAATLLVVFWLRRTLPPTPGLGGSVV